MNFIEMLQNAQMILAEGAVAERLRRRPDLSLHPILFNAPLIYDDHGRKCLTEIYQQYRNIAKRHELPILLCAPTWRVDKVRIAAAEFTDGLNRDAVAFMRNLQKTWQSETSPIFVGGLIGPKNDCYSPEESLAALDAEAYHAWQVSELAAGDGVDCIIGQTFPAVNEALGLARACSSAFRKTRIPYIISFVINKAGCVLDGTPLEDAILAIDHQTNSPPLGYMVNCVHPSFLLSNPIPDPVYSRLVGISANASSKSHDELEGASTLQQDDKNNWSSQMLRLNKFHKVQMMGGCCGTDDTHLTLLAENFS